MENIKFSIIIPAYNCENEIENAVKSVEMQDYGNYEIIIVNDGSTDGTEEKVKSLCLYDSKIRLINKENSGPAEARNTGLEEVSGDYILFIDSDDKFRKGLFKKLNEVISESYPDTVIFGFSQIFLKNGETMDYFYKSGSFSCVSDMGRDFALMYKNNLFNQVWNKAFKREFLNRNNIRFPDYKYGEDKLFVASVLKSADGIVCIDSIFYDYIIDSQSSLISSYYDKKLENIIKCRNEFTELNRMSGNADNSSVDFLFLKGVISCLTVLKSKTCQLNKNEKKAEIKKTVCNKYVKTFLAKPLNFGFSYEIIRLVILSGNYYLILFLTDIINFAQIKMHNIFLKFRK